MFALKKNKNIKKLSTDRLLSIMKPLKRPALIGKKFTPFIAFWQSVFFFSKPTGMFDFLWKPEQTLKKSETVLWTKFDQLGETLYLLIGYERGFQIWNMNKQVEVFSSHDIKSSRKGCFLQSSSDPTVLLMYFQKFILFLDNFSFSYSFLLFFSFLLIFLFFLFS